MAGKDLVAQLSKKPPSVKAGILAGVLVAFGLLYWQLLYSSLEEEFTRAGRARETLEKENKKLKEDLSRRTELVEKKKELDSLMRKNQVSLPASSELPAFFALLQKQAAAAGVKIRSWTRGSEVPIETYVRVPIGIEITGSFYQINKYFHLLHQTQRPVSVEKVSIGSPTAERGEIVLTAKFTAATYRQADAPPGKAIPVKQRAAPKKKGLPAKAKAVKAAHEKNIEKRSGDGKEPAKTPLNPGMKKVGN